MNKAPAAVGRAPERLRSNNATPSLLSSSCTLRVTVDCDMSSAAAALLKLPCSATTIAYRRYLRSKAISGTNFLPPANAPPTSTGGPARPGYRHSQGLARPDSTPPSDRLGRPTNQVKLARASVTEKVGTAVLSSGAA